TTPIPPLSLHDALPISADPGGACVRARRGVAGPRLALGARRGAGETRTGEGRGPVVQELAGARVRRAEEHRPGLPALQQVLQPRSEEHTSELQSLAYLV